MLGTMTREPFPHAGTTLDNAAIDDGEAKASLWFFSDLIHRTHKVFLKLKRVRNPLDRRFVPARTGNGNRPEMKNSTHDSLVYFDALDFVQT